VRHKIGEAAARRRTAPLASVTLWAVFCGIFVVAVHVATAPIPGRLGSYRTGIITITSFAPAALYSARKRTLWLSVRWLRLAARLPRKIARALMVLDRLETWRTAHITLGMVVLLAFWWHVDAGRATMLERALFTTVVLVVLSGLFGLAIHDLLPRATRPNQELRLEDVEAGFHRLYVEAEEAVLGHSEDLVQAYLRNVRPLLIGEQSLARLLWAILRGTDPTPRACRSALSAATTVGSDEAIYRELVEIAARKVRLEHNQFSLRLNTAWRNFHIALVVITGVEVAFHVTGVLYFVGF